MNGFYRTTIGEKYKLLTFCTPSHDICGTTPTLVDIYLCYYTYLLMFYLHSLCQM